MTPRLRSAVAAFAGLTAVLLAYCLIRISHGLRQSSIQPAAEVPAPALPPLSVNPESMPHLPAATEKPQAYTNESLQNFLEQDKKRMKIVKVYSKEELKAQRPVNDPDKEAALAMDRAKVKAMAQEIKTALDARKKTPVVVRGDKVALLSSPSDSTGGSPIGEQASQTANELVLRSQDELISFFNGLATSQTPPAVDFAKQMVIAISAGPGQEIETPQIHQTAKNVTIEYRNPLPNEQGVYYWFQVVPKTDSPVIFKNTNIPSTKQ